MNANGGMAKWKRLAKINFQVEYVIILLISLFLVCILFFCPAHSLLDCLLRHFYLFKRLFFSIIRRAWLRSLIIWTGEVVGSERCPAGPCELSARRRSRPCWKYYRLYTAMKCPAFAGLISRSDYHLFISSWCPFCLEWVLCQNAATRITCAARD